MTFFYQKKTKEWRKWMNEILDLRQINDPMCVMRIAWTLGHCWQVLRFTDIRGIRIVTITFYRMILPFSWVATIIIIWTYRKITVIIANFLFLLYFPFALLFHYKTNNVCMCSFALLAFSLCFAFVQNKKERKNHQ